MNMLASNCLLVLLITSLTLAQGLQGPPAEVTTTDRVAGSGLFHYLALEDSDPAHPGYLYAVDTPSHAIYRKLESGSWEVFAGQPGVPGFQNGPGSKALFNGPTGACTNPQGALLIADTRNGCIRHISPAGKVSTLAGQCGTPGWADGPADQAMLSNSVKSIICLPNCSVLVGDVGTGCMRRIDINDPTCPPPSPPPRPGRHGVTAKQLVAAVVGSSLGTLALGAASMAAARAWKGRVSTVEAHVRSYRALREARDPVLPPEERRRVYRRKGALWNWGHHKIWRTGSPTAEPLTADNLDTGTAGASTGDLLGLDAEGGPQAESAAAVHAMLGQLEPLAPQHGLLSPGGPPQGATTRGSMASASLLGGAPQVPQARAAGGGGDAFADLNPLPGSRERRA